MIALMAWLAARLGWPGWAVRFILAAAVLGAISFAAYRYGTFCYAKGAASGRIQAVAEIEKAKKQEWDLERKKIESAAGEVEQERAAVETQRAELNRSRLAVTQALSSALAAARAEREGANEVVVAISADQLDDTLRSLSNALAAEKPASH